MEIGGSLFRGVCRSVEQNIDGISHCQALNTAAGAGYPLQSGKVLLIKNFTAMRAL